MQVIDAPLRFLSAADCLRFARVSFGALCQMLFSPPAYDREAAWDEVSAELKEFEGPDGFTGTCRLLVGAGTR